MKETRLALARHYLSLDEKGRRRQKDLAKYVPELEEYEKQAGGKRPAGEHKGILDQIKRGFQPTPGDEN